MMVSDLRDMGRYLKSLKKYCKCGCGEFTNWSKNKHKYFDYLNGHKRKNKTQSDCTKKKISISNLGKNKGKKRSEETKRKISLFQKGRITTDETKIKISRANKGRKYSEEYKKKMSLFLKGRKASEETKLKMSLAQRGEKGSNWQGGKNNNPYGYDWTDTLKESIRQRDNYCCRLCGRGQKNKKHAVHHIDYNKENNDPMNLITLCNNCHIRTNYKRDQWVKIFSKMIGFNLKVVCL